MVWTAHGMALCRSGHGGCQYLQELDIDWGERMYNTHDLNIMLLHLCICSSEALSESLGINCFAVTMLLPNVWAVRCHEHLLLRTAREKERTTQRRGKLPCL